MRLASFRPSTKGRISLAAAGNYVLTLRPASLESRSLVFNPQEFS